MLPKEFHIGNRQELYEKLPERSTLVLFAGEAPRQSADAYYPFFTNRNFLYLTGMEEEHLIFLAVKRGNAVEERVYLQEPDPMQERWFGHRIHAEMVPDTYGIEDCRLIGDFADDFDRLAGSGTVDTLWIDFDRETPEETNPAQRFADSAANCYPYLKLCNVHPLLRDLRTIKKPCEIEAMRKAAVITGQGIVSMMKACHVGMKEYQLKAEFDHTLAINGVLSPAFPSIICCGKNNFCIHYYDYTGTVHDGDMVLNDVGACWDNECSDVSRAWPANGHFSERQKALYDCIYQTSQYMFSVIKPGMPMVSIDETARRFCFEKLKALGLIDDFKDIRKLMWHDGAHHVGYDVHDVVDYSRLTAPGMVFCVDIGVYVEEWGIGFRIEDNCLVTENGCENLTAFIPRTIEEIEAVMAE